MAADLDQPTVLVVDDEPRVRRAIRAGLVAGGFDVAEADGGPRALEMIEDRMPNLVLTDLVMPSMEGMDFLQEVRSRKQWQDLRVIVLSGQVSTDTRVAALAQGADDVVAKPYAVSELNARIRTHIARPKQTVQTIEMTINGPADRPTGWVRRWRYWPLLLLAIAILVNLGGRAEQAAGVAGAVVVAIAAAVFVGAWFTDAFGGLVVGLSGAAAASVVVSRSPEKFSADGLVVGSGIGLMVVLGLVVGLIAAWARRRRRLSSARSSDGRSQAAQRSIGMLSPAAGALRLEEELARASLHTRPLVLATFGIDVHDDTLGADDIDRLRRAVARIIETALHPTDIPYAIGDRSFAVIMPEVGVDEAASVLAPVVAAAEHATFAARGDGRRMAVTDVAEIRVRVDSAGSLVHTG